MVLRERFSAGAQDSAQRAFEITQRYGHNQVDTQHILLAYLEQPQGTVPQILEKLSVDPEQIKKRLDDVLRASPMDEPSAPAPNGQVFISPRVKRIIDLANDEANQRQDEHISVEHLFLSVLSEHDTAVAAILSEAGLTR